MSVSIPAGRVNRGRRGHKGGLERARSAALLRYLQNAKQILLSAGSIPHIGQQLGDSKPRLERATDQLVDAGQARLAVAHERVWVVLTRKGLGR
jgi:hypothetical protein